MKARGLDTMKLADLLVQNGLTQSAKVVYIFLVVYADIYSCKCCPSQKFIAKQTGMSRRAVQNSLKLLEDAEYVVIKRNETNGTLEYHLSEMFTHEFEDLEACTRFLPTPKSLTLKREQAAPAIVTFIPKTTQKLQAKSTLQVAKIASDSVIISTGSAKNAHGINARTRSKYNNIKLKFNNNTPLNPPKQANTKVLHKGCVSLPSFSQPKNSKTADALEAFNQVWSIWPRKEAKERAQKMWLIHWQNKALPDLPELMSKIKAFVPTREQRFIPYLGNWLFDQRWKDEYQTQQTQPQSFYSQSSSKTPEQKLQEQLEHERWVKMCRERQRRETESAQRNGWHRL